MGQVKLAVALWFTLCGLSSAAGAAPLYDLRTGGLGLSGPATSHPASFLYNPAALELNPRSILAVYVDGTLRLDHGTIQRSPLDTLTGRSTTASAPGVRTFEDQALLEAFPQPILAVSSSLASDSVTISLSGHTAMTRRLDFLRDGDGSWFDGGEQGPARYAGTDLTQYHLFGTLAASWRIADFFVVGVSTSLVWGSLEMGFVRDAALEGGTTREAGETVALEDCGSGEPCNYESDDAAEALRVAGTAWGIGFSVGVLVRPHPDIDVGLAYVSRVLGFDGREMVAQGEAWVRRSQASYLNALADPSIERVDRDLSGRGSMTYALPDAINLGATWRLTRRWLANLQLRWINYSVHDRLNIRLSGSMFRRQPQVPDRIEHHRGFQDVWAVQAGGAFRVRETLELQSALMVETAAVPGESVTPVTVDSTKLDWLLGISWDIGRLLTLRAGYTLTVMPPVEVDDSRFSATAMVTCVDAEYDIDLRDCRAAAEGRGLPTMAGRYTLFGHRIGTSLTLHVP